MFKNFSMALLLLLTALALSGCAVANSTPTPLPTLTLAPSVTPSRTPAPTPSPTVTLTPFPALSGDGPYLMLRQDDGESQKISIYAANGSGRKIIELPAEGRMHWISQGLDSLISPDGEWLVFYTGNFSSKDIPENLPITLKLLNIKDGTVRKVAEVATEGYQEKLKQVAEKFKQIAPDYYKQFEDDSASGSFIAAFQWSIHSLGWSPDGRRLAFAAQIDGLSSDVYLYDLETSSLQQVEDSLQSVSWIKWSPDGRKIVFENSRPGNIYTGSILYAVAPGEKVVKDPQQLYAATWLGGGEWLSPDTLLISDGSDTGGNSNLQTLNINSGQLKYLWKGSIGGYAIDDKNQILALNTGQWAEPEKRGLYFVSFTGQQTKVFEGLYWLSLFFRGGEKHRFLVDGIGDRDVTYPISQDVVTLGLDQKTTILGQFASDKISISPDYTWLLMFDETKLNLYDKDDQLVKTFNIPGIREVFWRPDSQAIFYTTGEELYFLSLPGGEPKWVDRVRVYDSAWLP